MSRLLLLGCSERKRPNPGQLPAVERYDGPAFRVLRRYLQSSPLDAPEVFILSARFGLIPGGKPIPVYDVLMTPQRAHELNLSTAARLNQLTLRTQYGSVCVSAGSLYREVLAPPLLRTVPEDRLVSTTGSQGVQLAKLKAWLYRNLQESSRSKVVEPDCVNIARFSIRGHDFEIPTSQVFSVVQTAQKNDTLKGLRATAWYVQVGDQLVPPKWLVSQLTSLPVANFHSVDARRVLTYFGLVVRQA